MEIRWETERLKNLFCSLESKNPKMFKHLNRALAKLERDASCGIPIPKRLMPIKWRKYSNLWKYNLPGGWRMFYTFAGSEISILAIILDWMSHKEYERLFKYK